MLVKDTILLLRAAKRTRTRKAHQQYVERVGESNVECRNDFGPLLLGQVGRIKMSAHPDPDPWSAYSASKESRSSLHASTSSRVVILPPSQAQHSYGLPRGETGMVYGFAA